MCSDGCVIEGEAVSECPECGSPLNEEGEPIGEHCNYSPSVCPLCGDAPCDGSC